MSVDWGLWQPVAAEHDNELRECHHVYSLWSDDVQLTVESTVANRGTKSMLLAICNDLRSYYTTILENNTDSPQDGQMWKDEVQLVVQQFSEVTLFNQ